MHTANGYAAMSGGAALEAFAFLRRDLRPDDLLIDVLYCGVCHSDIHTVRNEWHGTVYAGGTLYPCLPGHEIVGRVRDAGSEVTSYKPGDVVAVGTMVDSCGHCDHCRRGLEQHCLEGATWTYNAPDRITG